MKKILAKLLNKIELLESVGNFHEADKIHQQFIKIANEELDDEELDDDEFDDDDFDPSENDALFTQPVPIFFNSETNQPIIHEGKMITCVGASEEDYPELRGKAKEMTGVENITIVRIPADIRKLHHVQTDADMRRMDKIHRGHADNIEEYPDIVYLILVGDNTLNVEENDMIFGSREDAEAVANVMRSYFESNGRDVDVSTVGISVSIVDSPEEGMSIPELFGDNPFIYLENSDVGLWDRPETIGDLEDLMSYSNMAKKMTVERLQELNSGKEEWELDDIYGENDEPKLSSMINGLHKIASSLEDDGLEKEAEIVSEIFMKLSKKKAKTKKNVPNNPSLWASCKAWAKRTFDVYPSAYANGAAAKRYKSKGGTWRKEK